MSESITLAENVYSGGTLAASAGEVIDPARAYALGVKDDGTFDRSLSTDQLRERAAGLAVAAAASDDGVVDVTEAEKATPTVSLAELPDASAGEVIAYVEAHPGDADRVAAMENSRAHPRKTVLEAIERARAGG